MSRTVADYMAETLAQAGVKRIYGVVGDSLNGFTDALRRGKSIAWMHMRHEEGAAFAAGAEAHLTGELAVCAGSCGPGNLHLINGLFDCHRSGVPVLAIAAHIPSSEIGIDYFQATHPESLFKDCSHYVELVSNPGQLPQILGRAMRVAVAKRGVAVVVIPGDVALQANSARVPKWLLPARPTLRPSEDDIKRLASLLNGASRITLFCGAGCAGAHAEVIDLARRLKAPIVHTLRGKEYIEYDNPYDVGMTGLVGFASGYKAMKNCDTLLILGADFPYRQFFPEDAKIAQIDVRPEALGNRCPLELGLLGSVKETLAVLRPALVEKTDTSHLDDALADYKKARRDLDALAESGPNSKQIHPQYVTRLVSELAADDAIFTCDVGTPIAWTARYLKVNGKRRVVGSFNHGSMANAMLQAIGAQAAFPKRQVVSFSGDGGFSMMMGDFISLIQLQLPVKIILLNNGTLGFVELEMKADGFLDSGCDLKNPNFAAMAQAMGIKGIRVEKPQELKGALTEALNHEGPALVDVVSARQELIMPPTTTIDEARHFGMFMMKAVLDGRAGELIDLAEVNLSALAIDCRADIGFGRFVSGVHSMPLYTVTTQAGLLSSEAKATLAGEITALHSEYSGVPKNWVHIVFQDYAPGNGFTAGETAATAALTLLIRTGRSPEYKSGLLKRLWELLQDATGAPDDQIVLGIQEVPASQAMEMGQIMPDVADQ